MGHDFWMCWWSSRLIILPMRGSTFAEKFKGLMPVTIPRIWRMESLSALMPAFSESSPFSRRYAGGKLVSLDAARGLSAGIGEDFAVFTFD